MKKIYVLICFIVSYVNAQEIIQDSIQTQIQDVSLTEQKKFHEIIVIESGVAIPLGKLSQKIGIAPNIGLWGRIKIKENDILNVGFSVNFPVESDYFDYKVRNQEFQTKPKSFMGMTGIRMDKIFPINQKVRFEWSSSLGYAFLTYDDVWGRYENETSEEPDLGKSGFIKAFSTFHIGQGIKVSINDIGFQIQYNYTPYHLLTDYINKDFGSHSVTIGVFYRQ